MIWALEEIATGFHDNTDNDDSDSISIELEKDIIEETAYWKTRPWRSTDRFARRLHNSPRYYID